MAFGFSKKITIDHTKCGSSNSSNFPVLFYGTYAGGGSNPDLRTVANGGSVQNANGYDRYWYSDSSLTTRVPAEQVYYNATTGQVEDHFKVSTLSSSVDTDYYLGYGDSGISTDPNSDATYGKTSVWDSNFKAVWHFPNGSSLSANDSTSNANNGTLQNSPTATTGKIDGGVNLASASSNYITAPALGTNFGTNFTVSGWIKRDGTQQAFGTLLSDQFSGYVGHAIFWGDPTSGLNSNRLYGGFYDGTAWRYAGMTSDTSDLTWVYAVLTYDGSTVKLYIDNGAPFTSSFSGYTRISGIGTNIGKRWDSGNYVNGVIDEVRYSDVTRSANWIATEYNNQNSPSTFYSISNNAISSIKQNIFKYNQAINRASTY